MEQGEMESFKRILEAILRNTAQPLLKHDEIAVDNAPDSIDRSQRLAERDLAIHQIESNFNRTQSIKLALERIADGSYGTCLRCDCDISRKRLQAVPWTSYCIQCQEIADKERMRPESEQFEILLHMRDVA
jgi:DnaK suppressor protein